VTGRRGAVALWLATIAALMTTACAGGGAAGGNQPATPTRSATTSGGDPISGDPVAIEPVAETTRRQVVDTLRRAVDTLYAAPVQIETQLDEEGVAVTGDARVDRTSGVAESVESRTLGPDAAITTRKVVVDGRAFLKSTTGPEAEAAIAFTELGYEPFGRELLDEAYTAFGRIGPSLDRIVLLLEELPFEATITALDTGTEISVTLSPLSIFDFYAETGLEGVGGTVEPDETRLAFRIEDGVLSGIVADGTHFHDGEALAITAAIVYTPIAPFVVAVPETEG